MRRAGIFGGTFNPIHTGHLIIAEEIREKLRLERLVFVPARSPPHKKDPTIVSPHHRYQMISLAINSNSHFEVSDVEMNRHGRSYTVDTLEAFRSIYPKETELLFIMGLDQALEIPTWKDPDRLFSLAEIAVVSRPGYSADGFREEIRKRVHWFQGRSIDISSTQIREKVRRGESIKYLVPKPVENYIYKNGLYREK